MPGRMAMDFLAEVLKEALGGLAVSAAFSVAGFFIEFFKEKAGEAKGYNVRQFLEQLGATSSNQIRELVWQTLANDKRITDKQREDLVAVLVGLSRGASMLNSQGKASSLYLRTEDLLKQLVATIQPQRKAGEKVYPNHSWVLKRFLGIGAFGEVWLAVNEHAPKLEPRAFKFFTHDEAATWLNREKDNLLSLRDKLSGHPQIVRLIDVGVPGNGYPFLELEYVAGGSLEDWIAEAAHATRPLRKAELIRGIVRAVAAAHRQQVYHCDLKPANILLTAPPDVQAKITDFGLSASDATRRGSGDDTAEPVLAGTPMYLPPEAHRPFADQVPALYDVFALGVIWYQLLVERIERPPYDFDAALREHNVDSHTIRLISKCLAQPGRRFPDAAALEEHLEQADLPVWDPVPEGRFDVQHLVREYVGLAGK